EHPSCSHVKPTSLLRRRYRSRQLQQTLDKEEGLTRDIYDVGEYLTKRWMKSCWRGLGHAEVGDLVLNCFRHTKIVAGMTSTRRKEDELVSGEIIDCSNCLQVRDSIIIDDFVCNSAEEDAVME
ncbi:hypothetical protein F441_02265, partial [Phytophthora nicotianae CJ01A1]